MSVLENIRIVEFEGLGPCPFCGMLLADLGAEIILIERKGGSLYLTIGVLAGILRARETGKGAVIDAAIVDGSAHMMNLLYSLRGAGGLPDERGASMLDGAHFYAAYECADKKWLSVGPLEHKFYQEFLAKLGLQDDEQFAIQFDQQSWPAMKQRLAEVFASKPRDHWNNLFEGLDACVAPVLSPSEVTQDAHMQAREVTREINGVLQAVAAPRFDGVMPSDPLPPPAKGQHADAILKIAGVDESVIKACRDAGAL